MQRDVLNYNDTMEHLRRVADRIASDAGILEEPSVKKRLRNVEQLVSEGKAAARILEQRVLDAEDGFRVLRYSLLSEIKKVTSICGVCAHQPTSGRLKFGAGIHQRASFVERHQTGSPHSVGPGRGEAKASHSSFGGAQKEGAEEETCGTP